MAYTEVTFGSGGTYATLDAALTGIGFVANSITEAYLNQVGDSTEPNSFDISGDYNGAIIEIVGHEHSLSFGSNPILTATTTAPTSTIVFESCDIGASALMDYTNTTANASTKDCIFKRSKITLATGGFNVDGNAFGTIEAVNCHIESTTGITIKMANNGNSQEVIFENNWVINNQNETTTFSNTTGSSPTLFKIRRCYAYHSGSSTAFQSNFSAAPNWASELFINQDNEGTAGVTYDNNPYDTTTFLSVTSTDSTFGIPQPSSVLTTQASQISDASENTIGINASPITTYVVGPYASNAFIYAPEGVTVFQGSTGVKVSWTDVPNSSGFDRTAIYWRQTSLPGAFDTPDAYVGQGVGEYIIPYSSIQASNVWYIRLEHAE